MNPLALPLMVGFARVMGWGGISNPRIALPMVGVAVGFSVYGVYVAFKGCMEAGQI